VRIGIVDRQQETVTEHMFSRFLVEATVVHITEHIHPHTHQITGLCGGIR
jgi:hypothetical protein